MTRKWAWVGIAISSIWIAVLFIALFAPELVTTDAAGNATKLPLAGIVAAGVAFVATIVVARVGFGDGGRAELELERERERLERKELEERLAELEARIAPKNETLPRGSVRTLLGR